jgi:hypothetical protein
MDGGQRGIAVRFRLRAVDLDWLEGALRISDLPSHIAKHCFGCGSGESLLLIQLKGEHTAGEGAMRFGQRLDQIIGRCGLLTASAEKA